MRALLKKTIAVLVSVAILTVISGCTFLSNFKSVSQTPEPQADTDETETGNYITIGVVDLDTYDPLTTRSATMQNMLGFIFEPLFALDEEQKITGILAESYQLAPDGKSIIINLKKNVIWHDGAAFNANDVVYTVKVILNNTTEYGHLLKDVTSVSAVNDYSVCVTFNRSIPNPVMLMSFPIIKNGSLSDKFKPIGTGPFYHDYDKLTAFEAYHSQKPEIEEIRVKSVPDNEKFISLFNASVIDIADSSMIEMTEYTPRSNATVHDYVSNEMIFVGFNADSAVFSKPEARKSVSYVIDRQNIVSHIYFSRAEIAFHPINPSFRFSPSTVGGARGDHGSAEKVLKDAGWEKDKKGAYYLSDNMGMTYFSVEILVNSDDKERMAVASDISDVMTDMGMKNQIVTCAESEFSSRIQSGNYDMFIGKTSLLPNNDITNLVTGDNVLNYHDEKTELMLSQIGTLSSENDKSAVYTELFEHMSNESPIAPICFLKETLITSAKIKSGVYPSVSGKVIRTENWSTR